MQSAPLTNAWRRNMLTLRDAKEITKEECVGARNAVRFMHQP